MFSKLSMSLLILQALLIISLTKSAEANLSLFGEYIGSEFTNVTFSDVPINPNIQFHFILASAIDYDVASSSSTNGKFKVFWDSKNLSPSKVSSIKSKYPNVKVALSIGGNSFNDTFVRFAPKSVESWVSNAVSSLTSIIKRYNLDGIDINYQHYPFPEDTDTFAECIGQLVNGLKSNFVISFASIAPFEQEFVEWHYKALWRKYSYLFEYVNFQFYAYDQSTTVDEFLNYFEVQTENYRGSNVLVSLITDASSGLTPDNGFFKACATLQSKNKLQGIFAWSADISKANNFRYEKKAQKLLAKNEQSLSYDQ
ncbi:Chitinase 2 [Euphorbia peplus]|nr:Chitinase 2 [Euphorbia peplus]